MSAKILETSEIKSVEKLGKKWSKEREHRNLH